MLFEFFFFGILLFLFASLQGNSSIVRMVGATELALLCTCYLVLTLL